MTQVVTPSITAGQVGKMNDSLTALCRKNQESLPSSVVQQVLEDEGAELAVEQFKALRARVKRRAKLIVRHVKVDRTKTRRQMITELGRIEYVEEDVLETMPLTDGPEEVDVYFFSAKRDTPVAELEAKYASYGLVPDYQAAIHVNINDPSFADKRPNSMQWKDAKGRYCYVAIDRWFGERRVRVYRSGHYWLARCLFPGVRKPAAPAAE